MSGRKSREIEVLEEGELITTYSAMPKSRIPGISDMALFADEMNADDPRVERYLRRGTRNVGRPKNQEDYESYEW